MNQLDAKAERIKLMIQRRISNTQVIKGEKKDIEKINLSDGPF